MTFNKHAAATRRPSGRLDGSDKSPATVASDWAFSSAAAELDVRQKL